MTEVDIGFLKQWTGKQRQQSDDISLFPAKALAAALDRNILPAKGGALPVFWEWLYFLETPLASATGADGHPGKGDFLPPVPLARRMWASGHAEYNRPLVIGAAAERSSTVKSVDLKEGSTGQLIFVTVEHDIFQAGQLCIRQSQNIVYREQSTHKQPLPPARTPPADAGWQNTLFPDPVLLFRYSALTFNGHRIHYDREYATEQEHYPGLVVHGPLLVTLLCELQYQNAPELTIKSLGFKAVRPTFEGNPMGVMGRLDKQSLQLWSVDDEGALCMKIDAEVEADLV